MKSLRRSLNQGQQNGSSSSAGQSPAVPTFGNPLARPSEKVAPPQKVIKALVSHRSTNPQELSYQQGDFWYVTSERDVWYEALNPLTGSRGLVAKVDFEEFGKGGRQTRPPSIDPDPLGTPSSMGMPQSAPMISPPISTSSMGVAGPSQQKKQKQPVYAIVQYDFQAERPDELDAKKGEPIVVIAQSNHEWFVAKPIGRLGGPGLIPVAFVEIRDPATGKPLQVSPDSIPMVEEWKKATADYKAASIPLGRFDFAGAEPVANSPYAPASDIAPSLPRSNSQQSVPLAQQNGHGQRSTPLYRPEQDTVLPPGDFIALSVPSFHNESGNYWFRLAVTFIPDDLSGPAYTLSLYRTYEDFYDFQISLLDNFPQEAGRPEDEGGSRPGSHDPDRILPYMPGPVDEDIDDELTEYRREELDIYVKALLALRTHKGGYVLRHELFRTFFAAKYGDYCEEGSRADASGELEEQLADMRVTDSASHSESGYQQYGNGGRSASAMSHASQPSVSRSQQSSHYAQPVGSRVPSPLSPIDTSSASRPSSNLYSAGGSRQSASGARSQGQSAGHGAWPSGPPSSSAHGHSQTNGGVSVPVPAGSGAAPAQPPYIKIKILDRATDDLIAIRVHPAVTFVELFNKVRARLGPEVSVLRHRVGMGGGAQAQYREITDDRGLRDWLDSEDVKLVLYAETE